MNYLVCYDGSENAKKTISFLINSARKEDSSILLLAGYQHAHTQDTFVPVAMPSNVLAWASDENQRRELVFQQVLQSAKSELVAAGFLASHVKTMVVTTSDLRTAIPEILTINQIKCIVVGSRGHGAVQRLLLGSLSTYLVHEAPCAVIVAR